jgi:hypothetical protein
VLSLLNALTVIFVLGGITLLWLNWRERRRNRVLVTRDEAPEGDQFWSQTD